MSEIPFWVNDRQKWVSGITKSTTCGEIIASLLSAEGKRIPLSQLSLVEHWKGVQRPLSNECTILKLWNAWGDEKMHVKFVLKRIGRRRRWRRRYEKGEKQNTEESAKAHHTEIERLMRTILSQGETIHDQLIRLHERERQIDVIEETVHDTRTKLAGKDYLLKAYLNNVDNDNDLDMDDSTKQSMIALEKLYRVNMELLEAENKADDLVRILREEESQISDALSRPKKEEKEEEEEAEEMKREEHDSELISLRIRNDSAEDEIDENQKRISSVRDSVNELTALALRLEEELDAADFEERELRAKLDRIINAEPITTVVEVRNCSPHSSSGYEDDEIVDPPKRGISFTKLTKSILKAVGVTLLPNKTDRNIDNNDGNGCGGGGGGGDDDNSDTGLSSLHSSTDEGTYTLDTLV